MKELAILLEEHGDIDVEVCNFAGEFVDLQSVDLKGRHGSTITDTREDTTTQPRVFTSIY
jgi:hypothetical protein